MRRNKPVIAIVAGAIGVLGISGVVYVRGGSGSTNSDAATFVHADMTIAKAIAIAERHMGGDAIGTGREYANGTQVFYVEVSKYGQKRKMIVDLQSGRIRNVAMVGGNDV